MDTQKIKNAIIDSIRHELSLKDEYYLPQPMAASVFFYPELGVFLYMDFVANYEAVKELIDEKKLVFDCIDHHQGIAMPKYNYHE